MIVKIQDSFSTRGYRSKTHGQHLRCLCRLCIKKRERVDKYKFLIFTANNDVVFVGFPSLKRDLSPKSHFEAADCIQRSVYHTWQRRQILKIRFESYRLYVEKCILHKKKNVQVEDLI